MKNLIILLLSFTTLSVFAQVDRINQKAITTKVSGQIFNLPHDTIRISQFMGKRGYRDWVSTVADEKGNFEMIAKLPSQDYYVLRIGNKQHLNIIFQGEEELKIYGDGKNLLYYGNVVGSPETKLMNEFIRKSTEFNKEKQKAQIFLKQNPAKSREINAQFQTVFMNFNSFRSSFIASNRKSPALLPVLSTFEIPKEFKQYEAVAKDILEGFPASPVVQSVEIQLSQHRAKYNAAQILAPGKVAPAISMKDTTGTIRTLESLRGKVVLIDFWASWCGPCRRENPNVVKLYKKYKDDGFEIYSVSMDKDMSKWKYAINKDNLIWPNHVSDLLGWKNAAGKDYGVSSIPFTVLIDKEGKVIDTKLRGVQLEQALQTIFGH